MDSVHFSYCTQSVRHGIYHMLPKELWIKVIELMTDDCRLAFFMCNMECSKFFHHEKVTMLLPKVLPVISHFIAGKDLLNSRIVCKKWNKSIMGYMMDYHSERPIQEGHDLMVQTIISPRQMGIFPVTFKTSKDFLKHKKQMKCSANPLPGNEIEVHLGHSDDIYEVVFQGNQWFTLFGSHVLYMTLHLQLFISNVLVIYASIREWIMKCPNLRLFSIKGSFNQDFQNCDRILKTLAVQINVYKLEFGPSIETLIYDFHNLPTKFSDEVFGALERTVKKLCIKLDQWTKKSEMVFTQVNELEIEKVMSIVILQDFLRSCFLFDTCFRKLTLHLQITVDWTDILIMMRTLKVESLELHNCCDKSCTIPMLTNFYNARLRIESLTQLSVFDDYGLSFDFLINFPNLRLLQVCPVSHRNLLLADMVHKVQSVRKIDITIREALYKDLKPNYNLWLTLPSLKLFLVRKLVSDKEIVIKYVREEVDNCRSRVLYIRR